MLVASGGCTSSRQLVGAEVTAADCYTCHGEAANGNAAPPPAHWHVATPDSHQVHLHAAGGLVACDTCHEVPATVSAPGHLDHGPRARVHLQTAGAEPSYDPATRTCAGTYCHGATLAGGTSTSPTWGGAAPCGSCHGLPPPAPHPVAGESDCGTCHPYDGSSPRDPATHVNGKLELGGPCGACHAIPPVIGAHARHSDPSLVAGIMFGSLELTRDLAPGPTASQAFGCGNCHDPEPARHYSGGANVSLSDPMAPAGSLKARNPPTARLEGGRCSDVYCHSDGKVPPTYVTTPPFGGPAGGPRCLSCHEGASAGTGLSGAHAAHVDPARGAYGCERCHRATVSNARTIADARRHVDGEVEVAFDALAGAGATYGGESRGCSDVYCHGATLAGGTHTTPVWTVVDGSQAVCGSCHAVPPPPPHRQVDTSQGLAVCRPCHPAAVDATGHLIPVALGGKHVNGILEAVGHPREWTDTGNTGFHAYAAVRGLAACQSCHGAALDGGTAGVACGSCHDSALPAGVASWRTNCTMCHGGADNMTGAPPRATWKNDGDAVRTGAHTLHVGGSASANGVDCGVCHLKPADALAPGHLDGATAQVRFGGVAVSGDAHPAWDRVDATCTGSYCHGAFKNGSTANAPDWTSPRSQACGTCHGLPPGGDHPHNPLCANCHDGYTSSVANPALHVNGVFDVKGLTCSSCHGDASREPTVLNPQLAAAPPTDTWGLTSITAPGVGAHELHLQASALAAAVSCRECHVVPTSTTHATGVVDLTFGTLATGDRQVTPRFDTSDLTCSQTYCHGAFAGGNGDNHPVWTAPRAAPCGTCHGTPPARSTGHPQRSDCATCHPGYTSSSVTAASHVDGKLDVVPVTCTTCHGEPGRSPTPENPQLAIAPPVDTTGASATSSPGVGAHASHLHAGALSAAFTCAECHVVPPDLTQHPTGTLSLAWGTVAAGGGVSPSYAGSKCTNYCHGASLQGGSVTQPTWTVVDGTQAVCGACHGLPPAAYPSSQHPRYLLPGIRCALCHPDTAAVSGSGASARDVIVPGGGKHVDGAVDHSSEGHPAGWVDPADTACGGLHGCLPPPPPETYKHYAYYGPCTICHGDGFDFTFDGGTSGVSCEVCHVNAFASTSCAAQGASYPCSCDLCHSSPVIHIPTSP